MGRFGNMAAWYTLRKQGFTAEKMLATQYKKMVGHCNIGLGQPLQVVATTENHPTLFKAYQLLPTLDKEP